MGLDLIRSSGAIVVSDDRDRHGPGHPPDQRPPFVLEAQRALQDLGYHRGPIDGMFGQKTRAAVERYQLDEKLAVTGQLDAETLERLDVYKRLFRPTREP